MSAIKKYRFGFGSENPRWSGGRTVERACLERIKQRCRDKNSPAYPRYGGRGIKCLITHVKYALKNGGTENLHGAKTLNMEIIPVNAER